MFSDPVFPQIVAGFPSGGTHPWFRLTRVQPPDAEDHPSGGVGGVTGAIPLPKPDPEWFGLSRKSCQHLPDDGRCPGELPGESRAAQDPLVRCLGLPRREPPDFSRHKVRSQTFDHLNQSGIGHHGNLPDVPMMVAHEAEMGDQCSKTLPASSNSRSNAAAPVAN